MTTCKRIFALLLLLCLLCCSACGLEDLPIRLDDTTDGTAVTTSDARESEPVSSASADDSASENPFEESSETSLVKTCSHKNTVLQNAAATSCTNAGYSGDTVCKDCGAIVKEGSSIPATGHSRSLKNKVEANCKNPGYTGDEYCPVCGEILKEGNSVPTAGHRTETVNAKDAGCTTDGYTGDKRCTVCGETIEKGKKISATGHSKTKTINEKAATESSEGYTGDIVCIACGAVVKRGSKIPKLSGRNENVEMVWIPKSGSRYHSISNCCGMKNPSYVTKEEAIKRGYKPCNDCHPG